MTSLGLSTYGVFTQGSNEFYADELLHLSGPKNHVGLNALGAPFAQLMEIEAAVKVAIRGNEHPAADLYLDQHFFASLNFKSYKEKDKVPSAVYKSKIMPSEGEYYYANSADLLPLLQTS